MAVCVMIVNPFFEMLPASPRRREVSNFGDGVVGRAKYTRARVRQIASRILANSRVRDYFVRPRRLLAVKSN